MSFPEQWNSVRCACCTGDSLMTLSPASLLLSAGSSRNRKTWPDDFEHYEIVVAEDGRLVELGHGAMGVTYKAFDIDLRCPVTLKVISEKYLGDESARLRFLREARAAASVRHPNVASVFHLGRSGENYFYAMEFVEGETLENLIKRSGRLDAKLTLEIATQVAVNSSSSSFAFFMWRFPQEWLNAIAWTSIATNTRSGILRLSASHE